MLSAQLRAVAGMPHKLALLQLQRLLRSQTKLLYAAALLESGVAGALRDWRSRGMLGSCCRKVGKHLRFQRDRLIQVAFNKGINND